MSKSLNLFFSAIMAGICISIGCIVNLQVGGIAGAVLFTFGLITVVHYRYALYTGTAGFVNSFNSLYDLFFIILFGNIAGCFITAIGLNVTDCMPELHDKVIPIAENRANQNIWSALLRAIFCGFLMTTAVKFAREDRWLPLLFAVPLFILAGFYHSIADTFYMMINTKVENFQIQWNWMIAIAGNFVGCNLYRIVKT
jgi:formate/nitrite transporter FocA (FNT family)